jgi:hypothetical protein
VSSILSVADLCERFAVGEHTVLGWIRTGELRAVNVARKPGGKPKWRVTAEALATFEQLRTPTPPAPKGRRRKRTDVGVIAFY